MLSRKAVKNHSLWWRWHLIACSGCVERAGEEEDWESKKPWWHHNLRSEGFVINVHADCPLLEKQADQISSRSKLRDFQALRRSIRVATGGFPGLVWFMIIIYLPWHSGGRKRSHWNGRKREGEEGEGGKSLSKVEDAFGSTYIFQIILQYLSLHFPLQVH